MASERGNEKYEEEEEAEDVEKKEEKSVQLETIVSQFVCKGHEK